MKNFKITYKQRFNDEILTDSYTKTVEDEQELYQARADLFEDPHVTEVNWEEIK